MVSYMSEFSEPNLATIVPTDEVMLYLAENNTEARCATYLTVPDDDLTPLSVITTSLSDGGAYDLVPSTRFNVGGILDATDSSLVRTIRDPETDQRSTVWVAKTDDAEVAERANAAAGLLLDLSQEYGRPLRSLIGEKRVSTTKGPNATQARLGVLSVVYANAVNSKGQSTKNIVGCIKDMFDVSPRASYRHVYSLVDTGVLRPINNVSERLEFAVRPDGQEEKEIVMALFKAIRTLASGTPEQLASASQRGRDIASDPGLLPKLIERSYASTTHTGKHTPHRLE